MSERIRVAHVGAYATESITGPEKALAALIEHLPRHGVDVQVWQFDSTTDEITSKRDLGVKVVRLPARERFANFVVGLRGETRAFLKDASTRVDLVHFHSVFLAQHTRAGRVLSVPYVISPRGGYGSRVLTGRNRLAKRVWLALFEHRYVNAARALHAVSEQEALELERLVPKDRIFYVPNGVENEFLDRPIQDPVDRTFLFLGRLAIQHKGIDLLLEAYSILLQGQGGGATQLVLAGPDFRGDRGVIEDAIRDRQLEGRVTLPGGIFGQEKWALIDRAYAFVLTSRWEGMPFALLEALSAGRPAIVTPETNMGSLVDEYGAGILVRGDPESIAEGMQALLELNPREYRQMQQRARALVRDRFTWDQITRLLADRYRSLIHSPNTPTRSHNGR